MRAQRDTRAAQAQRGVQPQRAARPQLARVLAAGAWPFALAIGTFAASGRLGFNPSDEGLILAQARRIAQGAVPHVDLFSPRPLASALLHIPEFWHPFALLEASRWIALGEFVAIAWLLGTLVLRRSPAHWSLSETAGVSAALLVNLHTFPLMAWHTLDGIALVALAWLALAGCRSAGESAGSGAGAGSGARADTDAGTDAGAGEGEPRTRAFALAVAAGFALGLALLVKQSFAPALLLGAAWCAWRCGVARALALGTGAALPVLAYIGWVASAGGFEPLLEQLFGARPVYGAPFVTHFASLSGALQWSALVAVGGASGWLGERRAAGDATRRGAAIGVGLALCAIVGAGRLGFLGGWGYAIAWLALSFALGRRAAGGAFDEALLALLALAWMTALSWGNPTPNLMAGSLALGVAAAALGEVARAGGWPRLAPSLAVGATLALLLLSVNERRTHPYYDRPAARLTEPLRDVAPGFGGIRTNPITATYLHELKRCLATYPASRVAILPDNAALYPLLELDNPFPTDWFFAHDVENGRAWLIDTARTLAKQGDYLVLAQTVQAFLLPRQRQLPDAHTEPSFFQFRELGAAIARELPGKRIACGPFAGIHSPPRQ